MSAKWQELVRHSALVVAITVAVLGPGAATAQVTGMGLLSNAPSPGDWPMYHRSYDAHRYSPLSQINRDNVKKLQVAWVHQSGKIDQGLESTPIVVDGI
ncbi:MAG TPA: quinonprotein alcohol dehydrogenase, partial [Candidatus Methylomirabilis sp.]|nr:quinonprotein alcohol dehydrogenase [Candidatus Methylomirabilis sp.]